MKYIFDSPVTPRAAVVVSGAALTVAKVAVTPVSGSGSGSQFTFDSDDVPLALVVLSGDVVVTAEQTAFVPAPTGPVVGQEFFWKLPISGTPMSFVPKSVIKDQRFTSTDTALGSVTPGAYSNTIFVGCSFYAPRFAVFLENQENVVFLDCTFENTGVPATGQNPEALIRIQNSKNVLIKGGKLTCNSQKHIYRIHRTCSNIVLQDVEGSAPKGNGMLLGTYGGQTGPASVLANIEIFNVKFTAMSVDPFNPGVNASDIHNLRIKDFGLWTSVNDRRPPPRPELGWSIEGFDWYKNGVKV